MIEIISGRPRGGKSLFAQQERIIAELVHGTRPIITNLAVLLPELNAYLQDKHPALVIDLHKRVIILTDAEVPTFWVYRGFDANGERVVLDTKPDSKGGVVTDFSSLRGGAVVYVIDELHWYFNAREWMKTGRDALTYLSMHGKLGDDVLGITQAVGNVDKQFRVLAQQYTYLRNLSYERLGIFRSANAFLMMQYLDEPKGMFAKPQLMKVYRLDLAVAKTYETAKGVGGIAGLNADKSRRKPGLPLPFLFAAIGVLMVGVVLAFHYVPRFFQKKLSKATQVHLPVATALASASNSPPPSSQGSVIKTPVMANGEDISRAVKPETVFFTGLVEMGGVKTIYLSDGRQLLSTAVKGFTKTSAFVDGRLYRPVPALSSTNVQPFVPAVTVVVVPPVPPRLARFAVVEGSSDYTLPAVEGGSH